MDSIVVSIMIHITIIVVTLTIIISGILLTFIWEFITILFMDIIIGIKDIIVINIIIVMGMAPEMVMEIMEDIITRQIQYDMDEEIDLRHYQVHIIEE